MITNAILNFVYGIFEFVFRLLPIPDIPQWYYDKILPFSLEYVNKGCGLFTWIFPQNYYDAFFDVVLALFTVNLMYDILSHFHKFK